MAREPGSRSAFFGILPSAARQPHCGIDPHVVKRALILHTVQTRVVTTGLERDEHVTSTHLPDHAAVPIHDRHLFWHDEPSPTSRSAVSGFGDQGCNRVPSAVLPADPCTISSATNRVCGCAGEARMRAPSSVGVAPHTPAQSLAGTPTPRAALLRARTCAPLRITRGCAPHPTPTLRGDPTAPLRGVTARPLRLRSGRLPAAFDTVCS